MTTLREAAQQALEAMEKATRFMSDKDYRKLNESISDLRAALVEDAMQKFTDVNQELEAALAEPVLEPAELPLEEALKKAYYYTEDGKWRGSDVQEWDRWHAVAKVAVALTRRAALAEPVQEPVGEVEAIDEDKEEGICHAIVALYNPVNLGDKVYTTPPQRKPLSEEQALDIARTFGAQPWPPGSCVEFARAVERAHGIGGEA